MKAKYNGKQDTLAFEKDKIYEVMSVEKGWYRIMTELEEDYLFPPELFELVDPNEPILPDLYPAWAKRVKANPEGKQIT